jgi:hypothetical protein
MPLGISLLHEEYCSFASPLHFTHFSLFLFSQGLHEYKVKLAILRTGRVDDVSLSATQELTYKELISNKSSSNHFPLLCFFSS